MTEKKRALEECLQRRHRVTYDRYRAQRVDLKRAVKGANKKNDGLEKGRAIGK